MAAKGQTPGLIAIRLGVSATSVRRYLNEDYAAACKKAARAARDSDPEKRRQWDTVPCPTCKDSRVQRGVKSCRRCEREARDGRWNEILRLWNDEDMTCREIAWLTRRTVNAVEMDRFYMVREGWPLKHRTKQETLRKNRALKERLARAAQAD